MPGGTWHDEQQCHGQRVEKTNQTVSTYPQPSFRRHFVSRCRGNKLLVNYSIVNVPGVIVAIVCKQLGIRISFQCKPLLIRIL